MSSILDWYDQVKLKINGMNELDCIKKFNMRKEECIKAFNENDYSKIIYIEKKILNII